MGLTNVCTWNTARFRLKNLLRNTTSSFTFLQLLCDLAVWSRSPKTDLKVVIIMQCLKELDCMVSEEVLTMNTLKAPECHSSLHTLLIWLSCESTGRFCTSHVKLHFCPLLIIFYSDLIHRLWACTLRQSCMFESSSFLSTVLSKTT